jgi:hypothetical protein
MLITAGGNSSRITVLGEQLQISGSVAVEFSPENLLDETLVGRVGFEPVAVQGSIC